MRTEGSPLFEPCCTLIIIKRDRFTVCVVTYVIVHRVYVIYVKISIIFVPANGHMATHNLLQFMSKRNNGLYITYNYIFTVNTKGFFKTVCQNFLDIRQYVAFQIGELPPLLAKVNNDWCRAKLNFKLLLNIILT